MQLLNENMGMNFKPLQNASCHASCHGSHGCAISIKHKVITVALAYA